MALKKFIISLPLILIVLFSSCFDFTGGESTSKPTTYIEDNPVLTGTVTIDGTAQVGHALTANTSALGGTGAISYQWKRGTTVTGTNNNTYVLQPYDVGNTLTVTVTRSGYTGSVTSSPSAPVISGVTTNVDFSSAAANGSTTQTTTALTLTFNQAITGFTANDITLSGVPGISKGTLSGTGPAYTLLISGFAGGGTVTVFVTKVGYTFSPESRAAVIHFFAEGTVPFNITFAQITDAAPVITGPVLYRVSKGSPTSATITVDNPAQYGSISWRVDNTAVTGTGSAFTLSAANTAYNFIGEHFVTVSVMKGGVPYYKTVSFKIEY